MSDLDNHATYVAGLRAAADFIEANADLPAIGHASLDTYFFGRDAVTRLAEAARALGRAEKTANDYDLIVERSFGPVKITYRASKASTCERVEVGTETQIVEEIPEDVRERYRVEREVPIYETRCPDSILRPKAATVDA